MISVLTKRQRQKFRHNRIIPLWIQRALENCKGLKPQVETLQDLERVAAMFDPDPNLGRYLSCRIAVQEMDYHGADVSQQHLWRRLQEKR